MALTTIYTSNEANRTAGTHHFDAPNPIPADLRYARFTLTLREADKLAVGISLTAQIWVTADNGASWEFVNETTWTSYGPNGLTVTDPGGGVRVNPNPRLDAPLTPHVGKRLRGTLILPQALRVGVVVEVE